MAWSLVPLAICPFALVKQKTETKRQILENPTLTMTQWSFVGLYVLGSDYRGRVPVPATEMQLERSEEQQSRWKRKRKAKS